MSIPRLPSYSFSPTLLPTEHRVSWQPEPHRAALLVHDMQRYFLNFYQTDRAPIPELIANIRRLIAQCRSLGIPVIYTAQPSQQAPQDRGLLTDFWGPGLSEESMTAITPELAPQESDTVLTKWRYSAFQRSDLLARLQQQQRDQLLIVGIYAHIGCQQTAMEAFMNDIQAFLVADAVADFSPETHADALRYVASRGGRVLTMAQLPWWNERHQEAS